MAWFVKCGACRYGWLENLLMAWSKQTKIGCRSKDRGLMVVAMGNIGLYDVHFLMCRSGWVAGFFLWHLRRYGWRGEWCKSWVR